MSIYRPLDIETASAVMIARWDTVPAACSATTDFSFAWRISDTQNARVNWICFREYDYPDSS
jgi:hypothetical protein